MTRECFAKGVFSFITVFRDIKATKKNQDVWYSLLKDLTDEQFEAAIMRICREVKEFYPTTNFVALVRDMVKTAPKRIEAGNTSTRKYTSPEEMMGILSYIRGWINHQENYLARKN